MIGSTALPDVALPAEMRARPARTDLLARARVQLGQQLALPTAPVVDRGDEVIVPLVGDGGVLGYRVAAPMTIDGGADGKYVAYVDLVTGEPLAVHQTNSYASGTVDYNGIDRYPQKGRVTRPAPHAHVQVAGAMATTDDHGIVTWTDTGAEDVTTSVVGDYVKVDRRRRLGLVGRPPAASPTASVLWDASADVADDAQVNVYLDVNIVKEFVRANVDSSLTTLDDAAHGERQPRRGLQRVLRRHDDQLLPRDAELREHRRSSRTCCSTSSATTCTRPRSSRASARSTAR